MIHNYLLDWTWKHNSYINRYRRGVLCMLCFSVYTCTTVKHIHMMHGTLYKAHDALQLIHGTWCMIYGAWHMMHMVHDAWHMMHGTWCMAHGALHMMHGTWCMAHDAWHMMHDAWYMRMHDTWYMMHDAWYMRMHDTWYMMHDAWYMRMHDTWLRMIHAAWQMMHGTNRSRSCQLRKWLIHWGRLQIISRKIVNLVRFSVDFDVISVVKCHWEFCQWETVAESYPRKKLPWHICLREKCLCHKKCR